MSETEPRSEIPPVGSGEPLQAPSESSVEPAEQSPKRKENGLFILLYGLTIGFIGEDLKHRLPLSISMGIAVLLAQLLYLVFPAQRRRNFPSFGRWARDTALFTVGVVVLVLLIKKLS